MPDLTWLMNSSWSVTVLWIRKLPTLLSLHLYRKRKEIYHIWLFLTPWVSKSIIFGSTDTDMRPHLSPGPLLTTPWIHLHSFTCAALWGDVACCMSELAAGWCVGVLPPCPRLWPCHDRCHSAVVTFSSSEPCFFWVFFTPNMSDGVTACCCAGGGGEPLAWISVKLFLQHRIPNCSNLVTFFPAVLLYCS